MALTPSDIRYLFRKPLNEELHFNVNGYANAWYIDPKKLGMNENFTITLYFKPDSYFHFGLIISGFTFLICVTYLIWYDRKRNNKIKCS